MLCVLIFCLTFLTVSGRGGDERLVSKECIECICNYDQLKDKCVKKKCIGFKISKPFWEGSGRPTLFNEDPELDSTYERCVQNLYCAAVTIEGFMQKHAQDCNGDGIIDCKDYIKLYYLGEHKCKEPINYFITSTPKTLSYSYEDISYGDTTMVD